MELQTVRIEKPADMNFILGQAHFIKTVEDLHEAIVQTSPGMRFGLAFCEASGPCLVRSSGNDDTLRELAERNAMALRTGHAFIVFMESGFPVNVLNAIKLIPEVCGVFCATANPTEVIIVESDQGRGIVGVIDGFSTKGVESEADVKVRRDFLRKIGYKF